MAKGQQRKTSKAKKRGIDPQRLLDLAGLRESSPTIHVTAFSRPV